VDLKAFHAFRKNTLRVLGFVIPFCFPQKEQRFFTQPPPAEAGWFTSIDGSQ
jgi:hypothetical protein